MHARIPGLLAVLTTACFDDPGGLSAESSGTTAQTTSTSAVSESSGVSETSSTSAGPTTTSGVDDSSSTTESIAPRQQRIGVAAQTLEEPLDDVPVLVRLAPDAVEYAAMQADGSDVRFVDEIGTPMPFEIERWDPIGISELWVRVPMLVPDEPTSFTMQYGDPTVGPPPPATDVWSNGHLAVWHFADLESSTASALAIVPPAVVPPTIEGIAGVGREFDGRDGPLYVVADPLLDLVTGVTVEAWVNPATVAMLANHRVVVGTGTYSLVAVHSVQGTPMFEIQDVGNVFQRAVANQPLVPAQWTYLVGTFGVDGEPIVRLFVDGEIAGEDPITMATLKTNVEDLTIGGERYVGGLDEVRLSTIPRSPDWVRVQTASMRDELLTFDEPQPQ